MAKKTGPKKKRAKSVLKRKMHGRVKAIKNKTTNR
jgi:hypothetical protein